MDNNVIEYTSEKLDLLTKQSHEFHQLYEYAMSEYGKAEMKLVDDTLNFGYKIIQVIGIFAGFGFTGIQAINNKIMFCSGELFLIGAIIYGVYEIKKIYASNLESVQKSSDNKFNVFNEKSKFFQKYINKFVKEKKLDMNDFKRELKEVDDKLLAEFSGEKKANKNEGRFLNVIIAFSLIGSLLLLFSFINLNPSNFDSKKPSQNNSHYIQTQFKPNQKRP